MSGIVGVCHLDGRLSDPVLVTSLATSIAHRGGDHFGVRAAGSACLACHLSRVTPESTTECQPVSDGAERMLVFDGRIDNRETVIAALDDGEQWRRAPDSRLVLAAYARWGEHAVGRLVGEFAFALFDSNERAVILVRDPVGCRPLYYWTNGATLVFGSEIKAILAHPDVPAKPNDDLLADTFLLGQLPYDDRGETYFEGISAVRPGWWVRASNQVQSRQYWDFDPSAQLRYPTQTDYAERFRELLVGAMKRRLRSAHPVAVATSGGLDSAIVLCVADHVQRRHDGDVSLQPLTYTPLGDAGMEENRFIALLESVRQSPVRRIRAGEPGNIDQASDAAWHSEWPCVDDGWCAEQPMVASARATGARVLLTGLWSDQLLFETGYLTDLFKTLRWREVARHLSEYAHWFVDARPGYFRTRFCQELIGHFTPRPVAAAVRAVRPVLTHPRHASVVRRQWADRIRRRRRRRARPHSSTVHAQRVYETVRAQSHRLLLEVDDKLRASCGVETSTPFLDRDVIAFLMGIPGDVVNRGGVPRAILRDAMRGLVPDPILDRRWRAATVFGPEDRLARWAGLSSASKFPMCRRFGWLRDGVTVGAGAFEFIGLECWSRRFFSGTSTSGKLSATQPWL